MGRGGVRPSAAGSSVEVAALFTASTQNLEEGMGRIQKAFGNTQRAIAGFVGAVSFAGMVRQITEITAEAVKFERVATGFNALASSFGMSGDKITETVREVTQGQIATVQIMESVNKALTLLPPSAEKLVELSTIATGASAALGLDVRRAFDDITTGIGRASPKILDNLGIIVNAREAYDEYSKSIGKSVTALSSEEKQIALLNQVIDKNIERFGTIARAVAPDPFQQTTAALTDLRIEFGKTFEGGYRDLLYFASGLVDTTDKLKGLAKVGHDLLEMIISIGAALVSLRTFAALGSIGAPFRLARAELATFRTELAGLNNIFLAPGGMFDAMRQVSSSRKVLGDLTYMERQAVVSGVFSGKKGPAIPVFESLFARVPTQAATIDILTTAFGSSTEKMAKLEAVAAKLGVTFKEGASAAEKLTAVSTALAAAQAKAAEASAALRATFVQFGWLLALAIAIFAVVKANDAWTDSMERARRAVEDIEKVKGAFTAHVSAVKDAFGKLPEDSAKAIKTNSLTTPIKEFRHELDITKSPVIEFSNSINLMNSSFDEGTISLLNYNKEIQKWKMSLMQEKLNLVSLVREKGLSGLPLKEVIQDWNEINKLIGEGTSEAFEQASLKEIDFRRKLEVAAVQSKGFWKDAKLEVFRFIDAMKEFTKPHTVRFYEDLIEQQKKFGQDTTRIEEELQKAKIFGFGLSQKMLDRQNALVNEINLSYGNITSSILKENDALEQQLSLITEINNELLKARDKMDEQFYVASRLQQAGLATPEDTIRSYISAARMGIEENFRKIRQLSDSIGYSAGAETVVDYTKVVGMRTKGLQATIDEINKLEAENVERSKDVILWERQLPKTGGGGGRGATKEPEINERQKQWDQLVEQMLTAQIEFKANLQLVDFGLMSLNDAQKQYDSSMRPVIEGMSVLNTKILLSSEHLKVFSEELAFAKDRSREFSRKVITLAPEDAMEDIRKSLRDGFAKIMAETRAGVAVGDFESGTATKALSSVNLYKDIIVQMELLRDSTKELSEADQRFYDVIMSMYKDAKFVVDRFAYVRAYLDSVKAAVMKGKGIIEGAGATWWESSPWAAFTTGAAQNAIPRINPSAWGGQGNEGLSPLAKTFMGGVQGLTAKWGTDLAAKWNLPGELAGPIGSIIFTAIGSLFPGKEKGLKIEQPVDIRIVDIETRLGNFFNFRGLDPFSYSQGGAFVFENGLI